MPTTIRGEHSGLWGVYISTAQLPNASGATEQSVFLREGHLAITRIGGTCGLYRCTVATLGAATWEAMGTDADIETAQTAAEAAQSDATQALADAATAQAAAEAAQADVDTVAKTYGEIYLTSTAATDLITQNTPVKVAGTTSLSTAATSSDFDMPATNRLRYTGGTTMVMHCASSWSATGAGTNKTYNFYIYHNGSKLVESVVSRKLAVGADVGSSAIHVLVEMEQNEYLELFVECTDVSVSDITITTLNLFCMGMRIP